MMNMVFLNSKEYAKAKAIHICNSLQPAAQAKIAKEYVSDNAENQAEGRKPAENIV